MKRKITKVISTCLTIVLLLSLCACGKKPLSENIVGTWKGQFDVAAMMYKELSDELGLGIDIPADPEYCDVTLEFDEAGNCAMVIDVDGMASAVGKCAEPFTSALFGVDTDVIVDLIMQYVAQDIPEDTGVQQGTYTVDDENLTVNMVDETGDEAVLTLDEDGNLVWEDAAFGQTLVFSK